MPELSTCGFLPPVGGNICEQSILSTALRPGAFQAGGIGLNGAKLLAMPRFEVRNYYRERFGPDGEQEVVVRMATPWSSRKAWVDQMLGYSTTVVVPGDPTPHLLRTIPFQCPELGYEHLYCSELSTVECQGIFAQAGIVPNDPNGQPILKAAAGPPLFVDWPAWYAQQGVNNGDGWAEYDVTFRSRPYEVRTDAETAALGGREIERYVEREKRGAVQGLPLPAGSLKFTDGSGNIPTSGVFVLLHNEELHYSWYEVPDDPVVAIALCIGRVNNAPFDGARGAPTYPVGTILCLAPLERKRYRHTTGRVFWRIRYNFLYRPQGHNNFPKGNGEFVLATRDGTVGGKPLYDSADLNQLFQAPAPAPYQ